MNNHPANSHGPAQGGGNRFGNGRPAKSSNKKRGLILPVFLIAAGCAVFLFAAWSAVTSPVLAAILNGSNQQPQFEQKAPGESFAQAYLPKPAFVPAAVEPGAEAVEPAATATQTPQEVVVELPTATDVPAAEATADVAALPAATVEAAAVVETGLAEAAIVPDTPTAEYVAPTAMAYAPPASSGGSGGVHWFDVDLSDQRMYAYEGDTLARTFIVSTGTWQTPTVTGKFKVWIKLRSAPMSGPGYYLPDVPYIMYFYGDYGIHGTYWHNNFGVPMSHGCVNLSIPDAEWAYNFASVGTVVNVHD